MRVSYNDLLLFLAITKSFSRDAAPDPDTKSRQKGGLTWHALRGEIRKHPGLIWMIEFLPYDKIFEDTEFSRDLKEYIY